MTFAPLPRITAPTITAAELLIAIQQLILEEPRRMNMNHWIKSFQGDGYSPMGVPACGTVACLAGWGAILLRQEGESRDFLALSAESYITVPETADEFSMEDLLGIWNSDIGRRDVGHLFSAAGTDVERFTPGSQGHARAVAERIDRYLEDHPELTTRVIDVSTRRIISEGGRHGRTD